jgi:hypothetical protein
VAVPPESTKRGLPTRWWVVIAIVLAIVVLTYLASQTLEPRQ